MTAAELKTKAEELVKKITANKDLLAKFKEDPKGTVKSLLANIVLDNDQLDSVVDIVKAKIGADKASGIVSKIGSLFGKK